MRNTRLQEEITAKLIADYRFVERGDWLRRGKCPQCKYSELYTNKENPWTLKCGRQNKCGTELHIKDLYPDLFEKFNDRYPPTREKPNATADAYMEYSRGLDPERMKGWYKQEAYQNPRGIGAQGTATVRFFIDRENDIYMERFVEPIKVREEDKTTTVRKQNFHGKYKGQWWIPPGMTIEDGDEIWIVEACICAASLYLAGQKTVASLSCYNYPTKSLEEHKDKDVKWVWGLDNDKAGRTYTTRWVERMREDDFEQVFAAFIPQPKRKKKDYNDAYKAGDLTSDEGLNVARLKTYKYQGALHLAERAFDKALLIWNHTGRTSFDFEFNNRLYYFDLDYEKYSKRLTELEKEDGEGVGLTREEVIERAAEQSGGLNELANCYLDFLYFQVNKQTDESWYYTRIRFPHGAKDVKNTFTGSQLSAPTEFKKRLLSIAAGSMFTGSKRHLDNFLKRQLFAIKTVETVDFIGYSKEHSAYVFNDFAVKDGSVEQLNDEDFFEINKLSIKSLNQSVHLHVGDDQDYKDDWPKLIWECFGPRGMLAVAFWFGSLFAEQIRASQKSYPFLEVVGEPGAGKSTLIEFLWKLVGRQDYEGFDPSKSTLAARSRNFSQVSNLPVVLIEADRDEDTAKAKKYDWDELKTAYNGRASRARGVKTGGNETYEPPFRGSIIISQNADVNASEAILQRIVHLKFDRSRHSTSSKLAAERLESMPTTAVSAFLRMACRTEKKTLDIINKRSKFHADEIMRLAGMKNVRIAKNHGQVLAAGEAMAELIGLTEDQLKEMRDEAQRMALDRQEAISADHPIVREFWDTFDYLNTADGEDRPILNHASNDQEIAINLNQFVQVATARRQQIPALVDLKRHLKTSRLHKFKGIKTVKSKLGRQMNKAEGWTTKCWVFEKGD